MYLADPTLNYEQPLDLCILYVYCQPLLFRYMIIAFKLQITVD